MITIAGITMTLTSLLLIAAIAFLVVCLAVKVARKLLRLSIVLAIIAAAAFVWFVIIPTLG